MIETTLLQLLHFAAYAFLVSGILGALRGLRGRRETGVSVGFLNFLPMVAAAVSSLVKRKSGQKAEETQLQREEENRRAQFEADEEARRQSWEEQYNSPSAEASRLNATLRLGRLLGHFGGREGTPASLLSHLEALRAKPQYEARTYTPGSTRPTTTGGWGFAGDLVNAAGYYPMKKKPLTMPEPGSKALQTWRHGGV